jgi:hypothetical protein
VRPAAPKSRIARYRRPGARDRTRDRACTPRRHRDLRQSAGGTRVVITLRRAAGPVRAAGLAPP